MGNIQALQNLLNGTASEEDINLLKGGLASGEISIGGNVNHSVIIIGNGNTVDLTPRALELLGARRLLGDLDRDLTGDEIAVGLHRFEIELSFRAPVLLTQFQEQDRHLRLTLKTSPKSLSDHARRERVEALAQINSLCMEALDISFNALCLGEELPEYDSRSPFRGLESFHPEDKGFFFGRESLTKKLVGKINSHPFLAILGASGSGKSSLVMAGLIPSLGSEYVIFRPGTNPLESLELVKENTLVVVDQFEELFTLVNNKMIHKEFISKLLEISRKNKVIITLCSDFLGEVAAYRNLNEEIQNHLENIPPMNLDELRCAMEEQAGVVGLRFEADLSQQILDDVEGEPGAMPLLQHALWELWNRRHGRNLRASEYRAFGGVKQAITSTAEKVYGACSKAEQEQIRDIFLRLTRLDDSDEGRDTRRRVAISDLIPSGYDEASITLLLDKLANARLIVKNVNEGKSVNKGKTEVEVTHEALIRHWERLRVWLTEDRINLHLWEGVRDAARQWDLNRTDESLLNHRGARLVQAIEISKNPRYWVNEIEQAYVDACTRFRDKEIKTIDRRRKITISMSIIAIMTVLVLGTYGVYQGNVASYQAATATFAHGAELHQVATADAAKTVAVEAENIRATAQANAEIEKQNSEQQEKISRAGVLASQSQLTREQYPQRSLLLAIESVNLVKGLPHPLLPEEILRDGLGNIGGIPLVGHKGDIMSLAFSPDGQWLATGSSDNTVRLWNTQNPSSDPLVLRGHEGWIATLVFSPDGRWLATGSYDNTARLWDMHNLTADPRILYGHTDPVFAIAFSQDGHWLATGSADTTARLWDLQNLTDDPLVFLGYEMDIIAFTYDLTFSPDSRWLATASGDETARLWDLQNPSADPLILGGHDWSINALAFSPNGRWVATGSADTTVRLWDLQNPPIHPLVLEGHSDWVSTLSFSPDGRWLATGSGDDTACIWDMQNLTATPLVLQGHNGDVNALAFSPDARWLATGSGDAKVRLWDMQNSSSDPLTLRGHESHITTLSFSPDGRWLATGSGDDTARLWDMQNLTAYPLVMRANEKDVERLAVSADGHWLATGNSDGVVRLWDLQNPSAESPVLLKYEERIYAPLFSPDGRWIAMISDNNTNLLWELQNLSADPLALKGGKYEINKISFSMDGHWLAMGNGDDTVLIWDVQNLTVDPLVLGKVEMFTFSPDGRWLATSWGRTSISLWDMQDLKNTPPIIYEQKSSVTTLAFSPDGSWLAAGSRDGTVFLMDMQNIAVETVVLQDGKGEIFALAFSPDKHWLATCRSGDGVALWSMEDLTTAPISLREGCKSLVFSPDGSWLATNTTYALDQVSKTFSLWDMQNVTLDPLPMKGHENSVSTLVFSPDGHWLVTGSDDKTARLWEMRITEAACKIVGRNLNRSEWTQYLPYKPFPVIQADGTCPQWTLEAEATATP
jgi:WD40 repeat protein